MKCQFFVDWIRVRRPRPYLKPVLCDKPSAVILKQTQVEKGKKDRILSPVGLCRECLAKSLSSMFCGVYHPTERLYLGGSTSVIVDYESTDGNCVGEVLSAAAELPRR